MAYISKYDTKFLTQMNRKYGKEFDFWDDYSCWLYYDIFQMNDEKYYDQLEEDLKDYVEFQNGKERQNRGRLDCELSENESIN